MQRTRRQRPPAFTTAIFQSTALVAAVFVLQQCNTSITDSTRCLHVQRLPPCLLHWLDVFICQSLWGGPQPCQQPTSSPPFLARLPHQTGHQTFPPPSTLPFSVHRLHFLREITLPQEQTRVLWVPARVAKKHLIEIVTEAEGHLFSIYSLSFPTTKSLIMLTYKSMPNNSLATVFTPPTAFWHRVLARLFACSGI